MNMFDQLLKLFGRDYWRMTDKELLSPVVRYHLELPPYSMEDVNVKEYVKDPSFWHTLRANRKRIIEQLIARDKFASSFVAIAISIIALIISAFSILVAFFK